jgi:uncharacterized protein YwqG
MGHKLPTQSSETGPAVRQLVGRITDSQRKADAVEVDPWRTIFIWRQRQWLRKVALEGTVAVSRWKFVRCVVTHSKNWRNSHGHTEPVASRSSTSKSTYFGGRPTLPECFEWPRSNKNGRPMCFIAQINLDELPDFSERHLLPLNGMIFFFSTSIAFYDHGFDGTVVFVPDSKECCAERAPPNDANRFFEHPDLDPTLWIAEAEPWHMVTRSCWTFPQHFPSDADIDNELFEESTNLISLIDSEFNRSIGTAQTLKFNGYQLLGHPIVTQYQQEQLFKDHAMLLQLGRLEQVPKPFEKIGIAQFWIRRDDLVGHRFDLTKQTLDTAR